MEENIPEVCFKHPESIYPRGGMFLPLITRESRYGERKYTHTRYYVAVAMHDTCDTGYLTIRFRVHPGDESPR
jgi:hypothetical protein